MDTKQFDTVQSNSWILNNKLIAARVHPGLPSYYCIDYKYNNYLYSNNT